MLISYKGQTNFIIEVGREIKEGEVFDGDESLVRRFPRLFKEVNEIPAQKNEVIKIIGNTKPVSTVKKEIYSNKCLYCSKTLKTPKELASHQKKCKTNLVSIIIPHQWDRPLICIDGIKNQTFKNIEIIVIVDHDQKGMNWTRNQGWPKAKGKYLLFLDDDITLQSEAIEKMVNALDKSKASYAYSDYSRSGRVSGAFNSHKWDLEELKKTNFISSQSLIRAKDFTGWDEKVIRYTDWALWRKMAKQKKFGVYIPEILFDAYYDDSGVSVRGEADRQKWFEFVKTKYPL